MSKVKIIPELRFPEFEKDGEWEKKPLEDVLQFQTGFPFDSEGFNEEGRGVRLIKNRDLKSDEKIVHYSKPYDEKYLVTNGDVLVGMDGDFTPIKWNKGVALLNQRVGRVLTNQKGDELFFLYFLSIHLKAIEEKTARTTVKHLSHSVVEKINEPIPKPQEQQKIASCLSSLDEIIATHSQKLNLLKDHKKGLMQNLFPQEGEKVPKYRFKEFEKDGEWVEKTLGEVAKFVNEKTSLENLSINNYISTENLLPEYAGVVSASKLPASGNFTKYKEEDILISNIRPYLKKVWYSDKQGGCSNDVFVVRAKSEINKVFLSFLLKNDDFINYVMIGAKGVKMPRGDKDLISKHPISFPNNKPEQQKIASCLSSLDALITTQTEKIEQLKLHKKGLMQGLFPKINE